MKPNQHIDAAVGREKQRWVTCDDSIRPIKTGCAHWANEKCDCECHQAMYRAGRKDAVEYIQENRGRTIVDSDGSNMAYEISADVLEVAARQPE